MKKKYFKQLDNCHFQFDENQKFEILEIEAKNLINSKRLDFMPILIYIHHKVNGLDMNYPTQIYKERVKAVTDGKFVEIGNKNKRNFEAFLNALNLLIQDFLNNKFDIDKTIIPVDSDGLIIDGAHRICCAAYFDQIIRVIKFSDLKTNFHIDYRWLILRGVSLKSLNFYILEYVKWNKNIFAYIFWPKSSNKKIELEQSLNIINNSSTVIFDKIIELPFNAIRNLIIQIYGHMDWVGEVDDNFKNTYAKANQVFSKSKPTRIVLVEKTDFKSVSKLKEEIRSIFKIGLDSVHSTDNFRETKQLINLVFNDNSIHHLFTSSPCNFKNSFRLFQKFKEIINKNNLEIENIIICGSMPLAIYGIRSSHDLDYISNIDFSKNLFKNFSNIDDHNYLIPFFKMKLVDILNNPNYFFIFDEIKFVSLRTIKIFKSNRMEKKDVNDIKLIDSFFNNSIYYSYFRIINSLRVVKFNSTQRFLKTVYFFMSFIPKPIKKFLKKFK